MSDDGIYIYTAIIYNDFVIYYTFTVSNGTPTAPGMKRNVSPDVIYNIQETNNYVIVMYGHGGSIKVALIDPIA